MGRPPRITRKDLLDCARRVFAARGFEAATLADIAAGLGVTPAALLRYVPSKQALFGEAMCTAAITLPPSILELTAADAEADVRLVLRRLAEEFVPFLRHTIAENLAIYMHRRTHTSFVLPFDPHDTSSPPRRVLRILTDYFRRAADAGSVHIRDPRAAALLFVGSLQSYVFFHHVLNITPVPLSVYLDALIDLWTEGAVGGHRGRKTKPHRPSRSAVRAGHRGHRLGAVVSAGETDAEGADRLGNARSTDGQRRLARRRPRHSRPDR